MSDMSLRGHLLIASPALRDPNFRRAVILLGEHGEAGAMGVVLNRRTDASVDDAIPVLAHLVGGETPIFVGGPVQPEAVVVLGEFDVPDEAAMLVIDRVGFLSGEIETADALDNVARTRVFAGYSGWGPGQLEDELAEESWIVEPATTEDVFTSDPEGLWSAVLRRKGGPYTIVAGMPPDPARN
jgi:putative transcriptional regulator